jgi:hypothetical protein
LAFIEWRSLVRGRYTWRQEPWQLFNNSNKKVETLGLQETEMMVMEEELAEGKHLPNPPGGVCGEVDFTSPAARQQPLLPLVQTACPPSLQVLHLLIQPTSDGKYLKNIAPILEMYRLSSL